MKNYTGVWSLGAIIEFIEKYNLGGLFKSRQFKNQCFNLQRKIPFEIYDKIMSLDISCDILDEFEKYYQIYLFEYDKYIYRKANGIL